MNTRLTPVNRALIIANVVMFLLHHYVWQYWIEDNLALWPRIDFESDVSFRPWQLITYGFLHGSGMHLLFNMFALYMFGGEIERILKPRLYLIYYLLSVVGAALMHIISVYAGDLAPRPVVGASGGVFGLLLAFAMLFPRRTVMPLFPPIPMPAWLFVTLYGAAELYLGVTQTMDGVAHFAHLGGMATGFVVLRWWRSQRRSRDPLNRYSA